MKRQFVVYLSLILLLSVVELRAGSRRFIRLQQLESLANATLFSAYQDGLGAMWFGTNYGLYRYNGTSLESMLGQVPMKAICGDGKYNVYAITFDGICMFDIRTYTKQYFSHDSINYPNSNICLHDNQLWVACRNIIYKLTDGSLTEHGRLPYQNANISAITTNHKGDVMIGTSTHGLFIMQPNGSIASVSPHIGSISTLFVDSGRNIWVGTMDNGAFCLTENYTISQHYSTDTQSTQKLSNNFVRTFCEDHNHNIWVGTLGGVNILDNGRIHNETISGVTSEPSVWSIVSDNQGGVWVGTFYDGVYYCNSDSHPFTTIPMPRNREIRMINAMVEDERSDVWIFTDKFGMYRMRQNRNYEISYIAGTDTYKFKSAYYDRDKDIIWVGTYLGNLKRFDVKRGTWKDYVFCNADGSTYKEAVNDIKPWKGKLLLGTSHGVIEFDPAEDSVRRKNICDYNGMVFSMVVDHNNVLWIGGIGVYTYDLLKGSISKYSVNVGDDQRLNFIKLFEDSKGRMWAASLGQGLFQLDNTKSRSFNRNNIGLLDNFTSFVGEVGDDILVVGSNSGISLFDIEHNRCYNYNRDNGLGITSARSGTILRKQNGDILIGGMDGIELVSDNDINFAHDSIDIEFDKLIINNSQVFPCAEHSLLSSALPFMNELVLRHNQTNIAIEVASFDYSKPYPIFYEYKLEDLNSEWIPFQINTPITFMNLHPDHYKLRLRATLNKDSGEYQEISMGIRVRAAWYATTLAKTLYVVIGLAIIFWVLYFAYSKMLFKQTLSRKEKENLERMKFFINISHEIRTPLTLIIGQLELFLKKFKEAGSERENIVSTYNNAKRMQQIVSNLLDFEKQNQGYSRITVEPTDMSEFISDVHEAFTQYANYRDIEFQVYDKLQQKKVYIDRTQMQRVMSNILINAFKFTPDGGRITIVAESTDKEQVRITVADSGKGISTEALSRIFDPFYQDESGTSCNRHNHGTGIGLALCKGIVELHHGKIEASSAQGMGATFTITFPSNNTWFADNPKVTRKSDEAQQTVQSGIDTIEAMYDRTKEDGLTEESNSRHKLLIVEDDDDLRAMLHSIFKHSYKVYEAANGAEGFDMAQEHQPDIIITDVVMPIMDGVSLCTKLKDDFNTCHIPIIMLTAKSGTQHSVVGINAGADDYIVKPFSIEILEARCANLLSNRARMLRKYSGSESIHEEIATNDKDAKFLDSVVEIIEQNLFEATLNVTVLCRELNIGKTLLTLKLKGITGYSPGEFIEVIKLKKATSMLRAQDMTVSEIAYSLGFSSPKYFTIRFKRLFSKTPTAFIQDENKQS